MIPRQNTLDNIVGDVVCTAAVVAISYRSLKILSTIRHLGVPEEETPADVKEDASIAAPVAEVSRFRRIMRNKKVAAAFGVMFGMTIYSLFIFIFGYVLPRFTSKNFLSCFWGTVEFGLISVVMYRSLNIVLPLPSAARIVKKNKKNSYEIVPVPVPSPSLLHNCRVRQILAAGLSASVMYSLYSGSTALISLVVASWILHVIPGGAILSVRRITQVMLGGLLAFVLLMSVIFAIVFAVESGKPDSTEPKDQVVINSPSEWILMLMMSYQDAFAFVFPGMLCAITLRYEHLGNTEPPKRMATTAAVELAEIKHKSTPLFYVSVAALFTTIASLDTLAFAVPYLKGLVDQSVFQLFISIPIVVLAVAIAAACTGQLPEWWAYYEVWVPKEADVDVDTIEQTLNEKA